MSGRRVAGAWALAALLGLAACERAERSAPAPPAAPPTFVGAAACAACHPKAAEAYRASDHARAMEVPGEQTVLADFARSSASAGGTSARFSRRDGKFVVRTDGPDGKPADFEVAYTFGFRPLQQYLIPLPGGRLQAFGLAWDTRPRADGGQRWFSLYPGETFRPPDPLHWTGREQTWNFQCAECHSTDLRKNYDLAQNRYATTWAELTVSCEACHGPGSAHVEWARRPREARAAAVGSSGLLVPLARGTGAWIMKDPARGIAEWTGSPRRGAEVEACARCHARRRPVVDPYEHGRPLLDTHVPALLQPGLYHADGQIQGEVYEYGSFLQSRMYRAGVTCSDCHEPHSGQLRAAGNGVCAQCHLPSRFDSPAHHRHRTGSEGARCVSCHMVARSYMVVDPRRDHGFRVPRPDLTATIGIPSACGGCHQDRPAAWAARAVEGWRGPGRPAPPHFATALDAGRRGLLTAAPALAALAGDATQPGIARATALSLLAGLVTPATRSAIEGAASDPDGLVRMAAVEAAAALPVERRVAVAGPRLSEPLRAVRLAAVRALAGTPPGSLPEAVRRDLDRGVAELIRAELVSAERPETHLNLSLLYARLGRPADAESALRTALWLDPRFVPAMVNLADLFRAQGREADGERMLLQALQVEPANADVLLALGLLRVRQGRPADALLLLRRAARARPDQVRFAYVYAVALHGSGDAAGAIRLLEEAHRRRPADPDVLMALAGYLADRGDVTRALPYAESLAAVASDLPEARTLVETLRRRAVTR